MIYVDVILPLYLPRLLTYAVPEEMQSFIAVGKRVVVPLGKSKLYTGIVKEVKNEFTEEYVARHIVSVMDEKPVVLPTQLALWDWIASYYACTLGEVMAAALPSGLKLSSETKIYKREDRVIDWDSLSDREFLIMEALEVQSELTMQEVAKIVQLQSGISVIKGLVDKGLVLVEQNLKQIYRPKFEVYIKLHPAAIAEDVLREKMDGLTRAPKQLEMMMRYLQLSNHFSDNPRAVKKRELLEITGLSASVVKELVAKEILEEQKIEIGRFNPQASENNAVTPLSAEQETAFAQIQTHFESNDVVLLHGVTSSGKTEIYIQLIEQYLKLGKQVLFLVPEIALTAQLINRLNRFFEGKIGVYHSRFNENERVDVWRQMLQQIDGNEAEIHIVVGARSSLFLPFRNLGLVLVDEEHETSFKQHDPAPRYNGRDVAVYMAKMFGAKVLLGSATPSIETYYNARSGKYGLVHLDKRFGHVKLPEILVADIKEETRRKQMVGHFSPLLIEHMRQALDQKEQIILFQNRRGFSLMLQCDNCGWIPMCKQCDISLTYHKHLHILKCHYCGYNIPHTPQCKACKSTDLQLRGFGTEKIEDDIATLFPQIKVARLDLDSTRKKNAYQEIIQSFSDRQIDILVGTQMITKGLDFDNVSLVGILNADNMLHFPDFRAHERAYQLMAQVSGRAGRREKRGKVIIQTYEPNHNIIRYVMTNAYDELYAAEILERRNFGYPPFFRFVYITVRGVDPDTTKLTAQTLANQLQKKLPGKIMGPEAPGVARLKNKYHFRIMVRIDRREHVAQIKRFLVDTTLWLKTYDVHKRAEFIFDVDPY